jgi:SPP1 gp7 family putative phage head morphogenesis protein
VIVGDYIRFEKVLSRYYVSGVVQDWMLQTDNLLDAYYNNMLDTIKSNPAFLIEAVDDFIATLRLNTKDETYEQYLQEIANDVADEVFDVFDNQYYMQFGEKNKNTASLKILILDTVREWIKLNINGVITYKDDYLTRVKNALYASLKYDTGIKQLKKIVLKINKKKEEDVKHSIIEVTGNKLAFFAEDQINKLAGSITSQIHIQSGIIYYRWIDMRDSRVRQTHRAMHNKVCSWSDMSKCANTLQDAKSGKMFDKTSIGGVALHPKMDIACRCEAVPIFEG